MSCLPLQINLLVGNYITKQTGAADVMKLAIELINWWKWHLEPFSWLQAEMLKPMALLTGCLTSWGSQVAALMRLCQFETAMRVVLMRRKHLILEAIKDKDSRARADLILSRAQTDGFWTEVKHMIQNLLPLRISLRKLESDSARLDQVLEEFGLLANHFSGVDHMMDSLEKRWTKMDQKLFLIAYVLHPARQLKHINKRLGFAYSSSIVNYAVSFHKRFFPDCTAADSKQLFQDTAKYLGNKGAFGNAIPNYQDAKADPEDFWDLMKQSAPQLSRLACHLFQIPVNSAAVERLFFALGNIHTKRRNKFVHDRVHNIALIKSMLPPKPRSAKQAEGSQYLGTHVRPTRSTVNEETAAAEYKQAEADTMHEYVDGPQELLLQEEQVTDIVNEYDSQLRDDEEDDDEYDDIAPDLDPEDTEDIPVANKCKLADLFVDMPAFDLNLLFEDDLSVVPDVEDQT